jgi:hypothetical protein
MLNKAFSQLTETERFKKFDAIIRQSTENLLNAEQIKALAQKINPSCQYNIMVHPSDRMSCEALLDGDNVLHIFIPENKIKK